jgi:hypothetical protein
VFMCVFEAVDQSWCNCMSTGFCGSAWVRASSMSARATCSGMAVEMHDAVSRPCYKRRIVAV